MALGNIEEKLHRSMLPHAWFEDGNSEIRSHLNGVLGIPLGATSEQALVHDTIHSAVRILTFVSDMP